MRIATLNTWGVRGRSDERLRAMSAEFARLDADVVVLQETILTADLDQAKLVLGGDYHFAQQASREHAPHGGYAGQGITTASRWPIGVEMEVDLHVTERTRDFACTCLVTEILAPDPLGRVWVANHFPDYQLDHERERRLQALAAARALERLVADAPGHVVVAGDMDADPSSDSMRFWTGRHVIEDTSVCYRDAAESVRAGRTTETYIPSNPFQVDPDWPFRSIDHMLVRCSANGPSLVVRAYRRAFDTGPTTVSDHYGLVVDYEPSPDTDGIDH